MKRRITAILDRLVRWYLSRRGCVAVRGAHLLVIERELHRLRKVCGARVMGMEEVERL